MESPFFSLLAVLISLISVLISIYFSTKSSRYTETALKMEFHALRREHASAVREWGFGAIDLLTSALHLLDLTGTSLSEKEQRFANIRWQISSTIDKGRLFLPNEQPELHGTYKPVAFQGFRQKALNILVEVYDIMYEAEKGHFATTEDTFKRLWRLRKEFVSEIQSVVDPREAASEMMRTGETIK